VNVLRIAWAVTATALFGAIPGGASLADPTALLAVEGQQPDRLVAYYDHGECNFNLHFDVDGVAQVDYDKIGRQYNPVTISQVALGCYHSYKRTKSDEARRIYLNQIVWLKTHAIEDGDDHARYEYSFAWPSYGLQPGWRSGLAQGQAISALIRYHYDTGDESVLPLVRKLKSEMLRPISAGGLVTMSPEGELWIEEYPSTPPSFVLNGFISAVFGLYEYTRLFPGSDHAKTELSAAIAGIKAALPHYDTGDWMYLHRMAAPLPRANAGYALTYIGQMRTLWEITGDPLFLATELRWWSFYADLDTRSAGNMASDRDGKFTTAELSSVKVSKNELTDNYEIVSATASIPGFGVDQLFEDTYDTYFGAASEGPAEIHLRLKRAVDANVLRLGLYNIDLFPTEVDIAIRPKGQDAFKQISYTRERTRREIYYLFPTVKAAEIRLTASRFQGQNRLVIGDMALAMAEQVELGADFGSQLTEPFSIAGSDFTVTLSAPPDSRGKVFVIYRYADSASALATSPWQWDYIDPFSPNEKPIWGAVYQFKILCTPDAGATGWSDFRVEPRLERFPAARLKVEDNGIPKNR
jgi:heparosan-N-sulfate-glucuronate 5-epimerase